MSHFQILLLPILALMGLAFVFGVVLRTFHQKRFEQVAFGLMFGVMITVGMINPISLGDGLIFDTRTVLIGAAVTFVGPVAGGIALVMGVICRIALGGVGVFPGVVGLVLAYGIACLWRTYADPRMKSKVIGDALLGLVISSAIVSLFILPIEVAITLLVQIGPTLVICNVLGTIAIGFVFRREIDQVKKAKELETHASTDPLTNLLNRRGFDYEASRKPFNPLVGHAVFYFDLDNFKFINDTFGHEAGDAALAIVAKRIDDNLRSDAIFSRQGGDEFSIYMPSVAEEDVKAIADRICALVAKDKISHSDHTFGVAISMGAFWTKSAVPMVKMIDRADAQLLLAKGSGKNRAQVFYDRAEQSAALVA